MNPSFSPDWHRYSDREMLARSLADTIAQMLAEKISQKGTATIAVSGGSTPRLLFEHLAENKIDWRHVNVTLIDERCVDENDDRSNAKLVKSRLLQNEASGASFIPLYMEGTPEQNAVAADAQILALSPIDIAVLGMGTDGHTASYFPHATGLEAAIDPTTPSKVAVTQSKASIEPRLTVTLPVIADAGHVIVHIEGDEKRKVLERAGRDGDPSELPIRYVLRCREQVDVHWSP